MMISQAVLRRFSSNLRRFSTEARVVPQNTDDKHYDKQLKDFRTLKNIQRKAREKKPQREPFAKNLFIGKFDTEILTYPELTKEEVDNLNGRLPLIEQLVELPHMKDVTSFSNVKFRQNLADHQLLGLQASQFMNGLECTYGETYKMLETLCKHDLREEMLSNEMMGAQILVKYADQNLKTKYLDEVIQGSKSIAFCMSEYNLTDLSMLKTRAEESIDKKYWTLNGEKTWIINGNNADFLIVVALTETIENEPKLTIFLLDKNFGGITCKKIENKSDLCHITFDNTRIPSTNVIGTVNEGAKILKQILTDYRLSLTIPCLSLGREIINNLQKYVIDISNVNNNLYETDAIKGTLGELITNYYAMESMVYLTTGLIDTYEDQELELECSIAKVFCSETLLNMSKICLQTIGYPACEKNHWANKLSEASLNTYTIHESNSSLKMLIALLGLQHAGIETQNIVKKLRNPLYNAAFMFKRIFGSQRNQDDNPLLDLKLIEYLHPSCTEGAETLEYCVKRLQFASELLLARHGLEIMNKHMHLRRMADIVGDIYAMVAVLGRSSRSYCIGLQHADLEMTLASSFCSYRKEKIRELVKEIYHGKYYTVDENYRQISNRATKFKGYFPVHPLNRTF